MNALLTIYSRLLRYYADVIITHRFFNFRFILLITAHCTAYSHYYCTTSGKIGNNYRYSIFTPIHNNFNTVSFALFIPRFRKNCWKISTNYLFRVPIQPISNWNTGKVKTFGPVVLSHEKVNTDTKLNLK